MKILLVNSNPVVSRLTALSARKESVELDEIKNISELKKSDYNIIFVDSDSFNSELLNFLKNSDIKRRVLFYTQNEKTKDNIFNFTILKPFLPSEVSAILRETKIEIDEEESAKLSSVKEEPKEEYLDLNELISTKKNDLAPISLLEDEPKPKKTEKVKKNDNNLEDTKEKVSKELEKELISNKEKEIEIDEFDNELFELDKIKDKDIDNKEIIDNNLFIEDNRQDNSNKDKILTPDIESIDEIEFEEIEPKEKNNKEKNNKETQILDKDEIFNIKNLLNDKKTMDNTISLEDVMTTPLPTSFEHFEQKEEEIKIEKEEKSKKIEKENKSMETPKAVKRVFKDTVGSLPIEELRQLLRGTKIHITIEFPKEV